MLGRNFFANLSKLYNLCNGWIIALAQNAFNVLGFLSAWEINS